MGIKSFASRLFGRWGPPAEKKLAAIYRPLIKQGDLCFDVGAHEGAWTKLWLQMGARVVAVEPQAALAERFLEPLGVVVERTALGAAEGEAEIVLAAEAATVATLASHWREEGRFKDMTWGETVPVPVTTLDALIAKHGVPRVCKIDVEGYEREVLKGLSTPIPVISFEFTSEFVEHALECLDLISGLGAYQARLLIGKDLEDRWASLEQVSEALRRAARDPHGWGDVFVKLEGS